MDPGVVNAAINLSIRKGAGASFAELDIAFSIQDALLPECFHIPDSFPYRLPPFQNYRGQASLRQCQSGKQACRATPDDEGPIVQFFFHPPERKTLFSGNGLNFDRRRRIF